jgi:hypothetical protein
VVVVVDFTCSTTMSLACSLAAKVLEASRIGAVAEMDGGAADDCTACLCGCRPCRELIGAVRSRFHGRYLGRSVSILLVPFLEENRRSFLLTTMF